VMPSRAMSDPFRISYRVNRINTDMIHDTDTICKRYFWPASFRDGWPTLGQGAKQPFSAFFPARIGDTLCGSVNGPPRLGKRGHRGRVRGLYVLDVGERRPSVMAWWSAAPTSAAGLRVFKWKGGQGP
jgi:hypothetical protein